MQAVKTKDTTPELIVRRLLHAAGYRYRLHRGDLPGRPDLILPKRRRAIFVHGCFWHGHDCPKGRRPMSNTEFWTRKIDGNMTRDQRNIASLQDAGWRVTVLWECQLQAATAELIGDLNRERDFPTS